MEISQDENWTDPETILQARQEIFNEISTDANFGRLLQQADHWQFEEMIDDWDEEDEGFAEAHAGVKTIPQHDDKLPDKFFSEAILAAIAQSPLPPGDWKRHFDKVKTRAEARIKAILDGHKRGAYERAAELLMALVQTQGLRGERAQADRMLEEYTKIRYNRFVAFKKELARFR